MLPPGFEPAVPANERPQTHVADRAASGIGTNSKDFPSRRQPTGHCKFHISTSTSSKQNVRNPLLPSTRHNTSWSQPSIRY